MFHAKGKGPRLNSPQLNKNIPGISQKMLTQRLRDLENDGLITRQDFKTVPPHVEYHLSEAGERLVPVLHSLCEWGKEVRTTTRYELTTYESPENKLLQIM